MELIHKKSMTIAQKNREDIPSFDLTVEGRFLAWIIEARDYNKSTESYVDSQTNKDKRNLQAR